MSLTVKAPKPKVCAYCKTSFTPARHLMTARACSPLCAQIIGRAKTEQKQKSDAAQERKVTKAKLDTLKKKSEWAAEAQTAFNTWIRERDYLETCISCGRHHQGQYHAGHFLSVGARPELRFEPLNVHKQCSPCNLHKSGNVIMYRLALREKIGADLVDWLEGPHELKHYSIDDLKEIKATYTAKAKALKAARA